MIKLNYTDEAKGKGMTEQSHFSWITNKTDKPFMARKSFLLDSVPEKAIALVCGLGQFNFYVNGHPASDHVLDPSWSDYKKLVYYVEFDITSLLVQGENILAAEVGNGWYICDQQNGYFFHFPEFMPPDPNPYKAFGKELVLAVHAEITTRDGGETIIDTDTSWQTAPHQVIHSNVYGSEVIDGRNCIPGWNTVNEGSAVSDSSNWSMAHKAENGDALNSHIAKQMIPPVKVIKTYDGIYLRSVHGHSVYDFGQNVAGMLEFEVRGKAGDVIHAWPAEKLTESGDINQVAKNWMLIDVCESYIIARDDTWEKFAMTFTYFGGRYVALDCDPERIRNIRLKAISSAGEAAGGFSCDDERLMQIYKLVDKAIEANMVSVHTDCPTIERFAWQEENHLMAPSVMYLKQVKLHWEKFLTDARTAQLTEDDWFNDMHHGRYYPGAGLIPSQAPCYIPNVLPVPGIGDFYNVIGWGSSIIIGTWWHYKFYGDKQIIRDNYAAGVKYLAFLKTNVNNEGFINNGLGDWGNPTGEYAKDNIETAFLYADAKILAEFATILGNTDDACSFSEYAENVKENYNVRLLVFDQDTGHYCYRVWDHKDNIFMTQAAEAMPLYWGMVPPERENDIVKSFRETIEDAGSLKTGEVGQPYIIQMMSEWGMDDLLCSMILKKEQPSYYAFVLAGETTLGEYWEENPRSHCHDMMGHIIEWYYNGIAGIRPLSPGFGRVLIKPYLPKSTNHVKCNYRSASGMINVEMTRQSDGRIKLDVTADDGIEIVIDRGKLD
ncbi:MAG: family 78 glycoside hydrolase catalytic domain [Lachnospiraceae bacterium]|nr:family 78 glycoside hydrolase catalytic domain [Lachnospiraceae bacterium]